MTAPDRCQTCDRAIADASTIGEGLCEVQASFDSKQRRAGGWNLTARKDCETVHRVDWRARALAAEADAAKWRKVAPLIEALRDVEHDAQWDHERMAKAVDAVLCAAKDPHP